MPGSRQWGSQLFLSLYACAVLLPVLFMVSTSLKTNQEITMHPDHFFPTAVKIANYLEAWRGAQMGTYFKNSLIITTGSIAAILVLSAMAGYALARYSHVYSRAGYVLFVSGLMVPPQLAVIPLFLLMKNLSLLNSYLGMVLLYTASALPMSVFVLTGFFRLLPMALEEAAVIDGASPFQVFWRVLLPLTRPALAAVAIMNMVHIWNDFFFPMLFLTDKQMKTLPLGLLVFKNEFSTNHALMFAGVVIASVPTVIAFVALQKQFIAGMTAGATKG